MSKKAIYYAARGVKPMGCWDCCRRPCKCRDGRATKRAARQLLRREVEIDADQSYVDMRPFYWRTEG